MKGNLKARKKIKRRGVTYKLIRTYKRSLAAYGNAISMRKKGQGAYVSVIEGGYALYQKMPRKV